MLRRWIQHVLLTVLAGLAATGAVAQAAAPLVEIVQPASITADLGALRVEVKF